MSVRMPFLMIRSPNVTPKYPIIATSASLDPGVPVFLCSDKLAINISNDAYVWFRSISYLSSLRAISRVSILPSFPNEV